RFQPATGDARAARPARLRDTAGQPAGVTARQHRTAAWRGSQPARQRHDSGDVSPGGSYTPAIARHSQALPMGQAYGAELSRRGGAGWGEGPGGLDQGSGRTWRTIQPQSGIPSTLMNAATPKALAK